MGAAVSTQLWFLYSKALGRLFVEKAFALAVRLEPFAIDDQLRDGALASSFDHFLGGSGSAFDIDVLEGNIVLFQEAFGFATIRAPEG